MTTGINLCIILLFVVISLLLVSLIQDQHKKWMALLVSSVGFYTFMLGPSTCIILLLLILVYYTSRKMSAIKGLLPITIVVLLIPLIIYKFSLVNTHFANQTTEAWVKALMLHPTAIFKIMGLSYFTFNAISYLIDIKRRYITVQPHFGKLALYLLYYPAVFSGPLHRAKYLFGEFEQIRLLPENLSRGFRLILWGVFKNTVIAQRLLFLLVALQSQAVAGVFYLIEGLLFFLFLYCNFSSFIDLFQGVSQLFNIKMKNNFSNRVYWAHSRQHFWSGWHITLNEWFRDYFFFVLSKKDRQRRYSYLILFVTFLLIALWHEISVVLLIWGVLNGLWVVMEKKANPKSWKFPAFRKVMGVAYHLLLSSFLALVFITPSIGQFFNRLFGPNVFPISFLQEHKVSIALVVLSFLLMDFINRQAGSKRIDDFFHSRSPLFRWSVYSILLVLIIMTGMSGNVDNYYIQF